MLEDHNKTSHLYDRPAAFTIYQKICDKHYALLGMLLQRLDVP